MAGRFLANGSLENSAGEGPASRRSRGNVQIYYNGATIEADRVVYDQATKRLRAESARLTEYNGKVRVGLGHRPHR